MSEKISGITELISQLQEEGISQGELRKKEIISDANKEKEIIISKAKKEAEEIKNNSIKEYNAKKTEMDKELKISARDFVLDFSNKIKSFIIRPQVRKEIDSVLLDTKFMKSILKTIIQDILSKQNDSISVIVSSSIKKDISDFFHKKIINEIKEKNNIKLDFEDNLKGFKINKKDENLFWDFTVDTISAEISRFIEPHLIKYFIDNNIK